MLWIVFVNIDINFGSAMNGTKPLMNRVHGIMFGQETVLESVMMRQVAVTFRFSCLYPKPRLPSHIPLP